MRRCYSPLGEIYTDIDEEHPLDSKFFVPRTFVDLVGRDLEEAGRTQTEEFAKFIVNSWSQENDDLDGEITFSVEPEAYEEDVDGLPSMLSEKHALPSSDQIDEVTDREKLSAKEIIQLLVNEFGQVPSSDGESERLIAEYDAGICEDIVIVVSGRTYIIKFLK